MRLYSKDHEWIEVDGGNATVGITSYAQEQLGDIVFVDLPATGAAIKSGKEAAVVESVKAASDVYAPVSGVITQTNQSLVDDPSLANSAPEGDGWFFKLSLSDPAELEGLMDADTYQAMIATL